MKKTAEQNSATSDVVIDIVKVKNSIIRGYNALGKTYMDRKYCTIYKVFHSVRKEHGKDYTPNIIAIGPFHHDNKALQPMEELKWTYMRQLVSRNREVNKIENYVDKIFNKLEEVKSYYSDLVVTDHEAFIQMMMLDGCFLIEYLVRSYTDDHTERLKEDKLKLPLLRHDLLLLENQYPYPVLEWLFDESDIPVLRKLKNEDGTSITLMNLVVSFVTKNTTDTLPKITKQEAKLAEESSSKSMSINHLLHAYHASLRLPPSSSKAKYGRLRATLVRTGSLANATIFFILSCFCCRFYMPWKFWESTQNDKKAPRSIPTATQLQDCGIKFKKKEVIKNKGKKSSQGNEEGNKSCLLNILHVILWWKKVENKEVKKFSQDNEEGKKSSQENETGIQENEEIKKSTQEIEEGKKSSQENETSIQEIEEGKKSSQENETSIQENEEVKKSSQENKEGKKSYLCNMLRVILPRKKVENKEFKRSSLLNILDVSFHKETGILEMSEVPVQETTTSLLRNLIAFEQCTPTSIAYFTSHATLMNNLIDKAEDVAVLKDSHVIESKLSKDEEVANLFNNLCDGAYLNYDNHHHVQIFRDLTEYCDVAHHKWRATLCSDYFGNPWAIMSVLAAIFLLLLTVLQSVYTVYPYYHPRN